MKKSIIELIDDSNTLQYCDGYLLVSAEAVARYIAEQNGKEVFEYDIFNCPKELKGQLKIGDFSC